MDSPIQSYLRTLHAELSGLKDGKPYAGIPGMAGADPDKFAICLATVDGYVYEVGDSGEEFTIQSISKPFTYGLALSDLGLDAVDQKVDVEPSGNAFNEISLAPGTGRPANAMINAGALTATSLIKGSGGKTGFRRILEHYSAFAGRELSVSERTYQSEARHGYRNRALAHLLRSFEIIEQDPDPVAEDYFRQCSVLVTCRDLSVMAATLANGGTNPLTGKQVLDLEVEERVLSVMATCGMYDDAGAWLSDVGMPAKSGVGGGLLAVLPGQLGLAVYSPPLNDHGSSVRGVEASRRISHDMGLHFVRAARTGRNAIRASYDITDAPSGIRRNDEAAEVLRDNAHRARVIELNGDLLFAGTESMVREVSGLDESVELIILDMRRVDETAPVALDMLERLRTSLAQDGRGLVLIDGEGALAQRFEEDGRAVPSFATRTAAVEFAEDQLIASFGDELCRPATVDVADSPVLSPLAAEDAAALAALMEEHSYADGEVIRRIRQRFGGVYFILSGSVVTTSPGPANSRVKLTTVSAGMTFGELALGSADRQETTVRAHGEVRVNLLPAEAISRMEHDNPRLAVELWKALTRDAYAHVDRYMRETAVRIRD
ncbi:glutaminase A [Arthrobacter sp. CAU 1506]|uniref:glutaminase A n=1 Tax=Arthrobacter sp. CAU 1506 TaxID=2560052 RepID=UPI0010AC0E38|nr:glutaminase A [Arthrobacter sp. CAU 1506]TJY66348.1 glutaminase A [Arthrobacter sp. CAU 1506]